MFYDDITFDNLSYIVFRLYSIKNVHFKLVLSYNRLRKRYRSPTGMELCRNIATCKRAPKLKCLSRHMAFIACSWLTKYRYIYIQITLFLPTDVDIRFIPQGKVDNNLGLDSLAGPKALKPNHCRQLTL